MFSEHESPHKKVQRNERNALLHKALAVLDTTHPELATAVRMCGLEGRSSREAAALLGEKRHATICERKRKGLKKLAVLLPPRADLFD